MSVALTVDGSVARLRLDRAEKRNAITQAMWLELAGVAQEARSARVVVLEGAPGGVFSAGADIGEFSAGVGDSGWRRDNQAAIRAAMDAIAGLPMPTVALVEGDCVGGGCGLALCCDLIVAGPGARFGITPAKLGLVYSLEDTRRLVERVGAAQAKRILFTGALLDAGEAARIGLATLVADDPRATVDTLVQTLLGASGHSQRESKAMIRRILDGQLADDAETLRLFAAAFDGPDFAEGSAAFLERRPADFR